MVRDIDDLPGVAAAVDSRPGSQSAPPISIWR